MFSQHRQILILESLLLVMFHLVFNIRYDGIFRRDANRKSPVAILPSKLVDQATGVIDVLAGARLELPNKLGNCDLGWNAYEQVSMVIETTNLNRKSVQFFCGASHIRKDIFPKAVGEPSLAVFGTEDDVIEKLLMSAHGFFPG
jgi:hypothetical protein